MWPRWFRMSDVDNKYLELMKLTYNLLVATPTDQQAHFLIQQIKPGVMLSMGEVVDLVRSTKEFYGRIEVRSTTFDRMIVRHRLEDVYHRAKLAGDLREERLALLQLQKLDDLAIKEAKDSGPVIPELPNVIITNRIEAAIIESIPGEDEEE